MNPIPNKVLDKSFVLFGGDVQRINMLERMLFFAGATVQAATTAEKGINFMRNVRPDIVIIDDSVSDLSLSQIAEIIAGDALIQKTPIILIGEDKNKEVYGESFRDLTCHVIPQSNFDVMNLILVIETILQKSKPGPEQMFDFSESDSRIEKVGGTHLIKLLVVEDDPLLRNLLSIRLQKSAIQHEFCHSGTDALNAVRTFVPTIIILDLMLPGKSGMEILREMRADVNLQAIPVIIFSNKDDDAERAEAKALGVDDFLVKATTDLGELISKIVQYGK
jgi:DNA-binding response OmpR family regulator